MKKLYQLLLVISILVFINSCEENPGDPNVNNNDQISSSLKEVINSSNEIGLEVFKNEAQNAKDDNVLISPVNVSLALTSMLNGTASTTNSEIKSKLKFSYSSNDELNIKIKNLLSLIKNSSTYIDFDLTNAIITKDKLTAESKFKLNLESNFGFKVFLKSIFDVSTSDEINLWFKSKTKGIFDQLISFLDPNSNFNMYNAAHFSGEWKFKFKTDPIVKSFYNQNGLNGALFFMNIKDSTILSASTDLFTAFDLTYANNKYAMTVIYPKENVELNTVTAQFSINSYLSLLSKMTAKYSDITLPKFKLNKDIDLSLHLKSLGIKEVFEANADFSLITDIKNFFLSNLKHKTYFKMDSEGIKTSSEFSSQVDFTNLNTSLKLNINKPFMIVIRDINSKTILFIGKISKLYA